MAQRWPAHAFGAAVRTPPLRQLGGAASLVLPSIFWILVYVQPVRIRPNSSETFLLILSELGLDLSLDLTTI